VSQRRHGDSDKPATGYRVEDFAADVAPMLEALRIDRAVLAGHSGSCLIARRVAIDLPERVAGLVLEASPTTLRGDAGLQGFVESTVSGLEDPIDPGFARSFVAETSSDEVGPEVLDQLVGEVLKVPARVWREMSAGLLQYDDMAELGHQRTDVVGLGRRRRAGCARHAGPAGGAHPRRPVAGVPRRWAHPAMGRSVALRL
jgi:non-heme chloroperoxidase